MSTAPAGRPLRIGWAAWTAVAVGGFTGTEARYLLGLLIPEAAGGFPWTTLAINVVGSFLLAWLTASWAAGTQVSPWLQAGLGPGLLGSFTTFSAVTLAIGLQPGLLIPYLGASILLGFGAAAAGIALGSRGSA
ncbi:CrcB family protein [Arthrobacter sp. JZ12]|uniref:fluoride efflux transporter FluC n=1 Tax=Arthrobacter sp. JZ12 TaxID=2654190 RepID=UPI002B48ED32|nr:CrcB family protein [Arthrobacter sp. JZ12]WRH25301.1 CrcB family protein [Arthrobacter sp. JZ12]